MSNLRLLQLGVLLLATTTASANWDLDRAQGISGILALPEVFGGEPCVPFEAHAVPLFADPHTPAPLGHIFVANPWSSSTDGCEALQVSVSLFEPAVHEEDLPRLEFSYEMPGAIVRRREGPWFEIALKNGYAWVHVPETTRYLPVEHLLMTSLAYLREKNQVRLLSKPGKGAPLWRADAEMPDNLPLEVVGFRPVAGTLWLQVKLLEIAPCEGMPTGVKPVSGWLPLHGADGLPRVWFYSRGC